MLKQRWAQVAVALGGLVVIVGGFIWGAFQPWTANHFGYALPSKDGLSTYIYARGRRYHSTQVCTGADWCRRDREQQGIPRCYDQAFLENHQAWPLVKYGEMSTLFGPAQTIYVPQGEDGLTAPFIMADGSDCYVMYSLEGGP